MPYEQDTYSYVRAANKRGYATLNIDRLGDGRSTHPLSSFDNFYADVSTVHQVVTALRDSRLGTPFGKVIEVGHSLGGIVTMTEAGLYKDVNAIMPTGIAPSLNYVNVLTKIIADDYPRPHSIPSSRPPASIPRTSPATPTRGTAFTSTAPPPPTQVSWRRTNS